MQTVITPAGRRRFLVLATVIALLATTSAVAGPADAQPEPRVHVWLTLVHNNDGESALLETQIGGQPFGGVANFATVVDELRSASQGGGGIRGAKNAALMVSSGDNFLAGAQFQASLEKGVPFFDAIAMDLIGYDAIVIGNHEFDFGPDVFQAFVESFTTGTPFLSANLDFSAEPGLQALSDSGRIAGSVVIKQRGERFGIIGATTEFLPAISSPRDVIVNDVLAAVEAEIEALESQGVNKIILVSHLQSIFEDIELASMLQGVDIMVAGGGDELLANEGDLLVPGDEDSVFGPYPMLTFDADGAEIPLVTTSGSYRYVGKLVAGFDREGNLIEIHESSGPVRVPWAARRPWSVIAGATTVTVRRSTSELRSVTPENTRPSSPPSLSGPARESRLSAPGPWPSGAGPVTIESRKVQSSSTVRLSKKPLARSGPLTQPWNGRVSR